jgi:hypothetical protein
MPGENAVDNRQPPPYRVGGWLTVWSVCANILAEMRMRE